MQSGQQKYFTDKNISLR